MKNSSILHTQELAIGYKKAQRILRLVHPQLNLDLPKGAFVCLLGANGSGKSTLIRSLAGVQPIISGDVFLQNKSLKKLRPAQIARELSLVLTDKIPIGNLSVYAIVSLGRSPYTGWLGQLMPQDQEIIAWALEETEMTDFADRNLNQLSDGERQKVMIARALAQDTPLIMLDEPTAHLDLPNRLMIFKLLRRLTRQTGKSILLSTHELDLALQAADKIWLMQSPQHHQHSAMRVGAPEDLVLNESFEEAFRRDGFHFDKLTGAFKINDSSYKKVKVLGNGVQAFWTKRALEREGFGISQNGDAQFEIALVGNSKDTYRWIVKHPQKKTEYDSVEDLLFALNQS